MSLPAGEMETRWHRIRTAMTHADLEGILVFSNQLKPEPIHYVANYTLLGDQAFCYLPMSGEPTLFISAPWDQARASRESQFKNVVVLGKNGPEEIAASARSCKGRLAIAGREQIGRLEMHALEKSLGRETSSATEMLETVAMIKSPYECTLIREASRMADAGFTRAKEVVREGLTDYTLVAEIDFAMRKMGATDNFQMLAIGRDLTGMLLSYGKKVERGDLLLFEITPANGSVSYSAQLCRTALFGEPLSPLLREKFSILMEAFEESLAVIKPGVSISEVAKIQNKIITKGGYGDYCKPPYMRGRGHGFGLGRIDVEEDSTLEFAEGMSLVVHPNQFIPETGYLALGEHILVTSAGFERLTRTESKIYEWGGADR